MNPFLLLAGVTVAAFLFGAFLWSLAQAFRLKGLARLAHMSAAGLLVATIGATDAGLTGLGQLCAGALIVAAGLALWFEAGWARLLPAVLALFGAVVASGTLGPQLAPETHTAATE